MVNERYLVLNRHGKSIIETFFTAVAQILDFRCLPGHIFYPQNSTQNTVLDLIKHSFRSYKTQF